MNKPKVILYVLLATLLAGAGALGMYVWKEHRAAKMTEEFNTLTAERTKLQQDNARLDGENKQIAAEIADIRTQAAAQEEIIKAKGGDMATQQQKIDDAQKQFDAAEQQSQVPMEARARCEKLKSLYLDLKVRGADKIDCSKL